VFGFLGVLRILQQNNCLASATGAKKDHSSGDVYLV
jgi:anhydro-N-acetylmuramic acid kinase